MSQPRPPARAILVLLLLTLTALVATAQAPRQRLVDLGWSTPAAGGPFGGWVAIEELSGGRSLVASNFDASGSPLAIRIALFRGDGSVAWSREIAGEAGHAAGGMLLDGDTLFLVGSVARAGSFDEDLLVVALGLDGALLWSRAIGDAGHIERGRSLVRSRGGELVAVGERLGLDDLQRGDMIVAALANDGSLRWSRRYDGGGFDAAHDVVADGQGVIVAGASGPGGFATMSPALLWLDTSGAIRAASRYAGAGLSLAWRLARCPDGALTMIAVTGDELLPRSGSIALRVDTSGTPLWARRIESEKLEQGRDVACIADGSAVVLGHEVSAAWPSRSVHVTTLDVDGEHIRSVAIGGNFTGFASTLATAGDGWIIGGWLGGDDGAGAPISLMRTDAAGHAGCNDRDARVTVAPHDVTRAPLALGDSSLSIAVPVSTGLSVIAAHMRTLCDGAPPPPVGTFRRHVDVPATVWPSSVHPDGAGAVITLTIDPPGADRRDYVATRLDSLGGVVTSVALHPGRRSTLGQSYHMPGGGVLLSGAVEATGSASGGGTWLARLASDGSLAWSTELPLSPPPLSVIQQDMPIAILRDGGIATIGEAYDPDAFEGSFSLVLAMLDSNGVLRRTRAFDDSTMIRPIILAPTRDGGLLGAGRASRVNWGRVALMRFDSAGRMLWQRWVGGPGFAEPTVVMLEEEPDGRIILGMRAQEFVNNQIQESVPIIARLDGAGELLDARRLGSGSNERVVRGHRLGDGGLLLIGSRRSFARGGMPVPWLIRLDSALRVVWSAQYPSDRFPTWRASTLVDACEMPDGSYRAVGRFDQSMTPTKQDVEVFAIDSAGYDGCESERVGSMNEPEPMTSLVMPTIADEGWTPPDRPHDAVIEPLAVTSGNACGEDPTRVRDESRDASTLSIAPSPVRRGGSVCVSITAQSALELIDASGRLVRRMTIAPDARRHCFGTADLPAGVYLLRQAHERGVDAVRLVVH